MKKILLLSAIVMSSAMAKTIPWGSGVGPRPFDTFSGQKFLYLDTADRQKILGDLFNGVKDTYALYDIKKVRINRDTENDYKAALEVEAKIKDPADSEIYAQAKGNLAFYDRVTAFVSAFHDTHFHIAPAYGMGAITLGLYLGKFEGKYILTGTIPKLMAYNDAAVSSPDSGVVTAFSTLAKGDQILEYNGKSIEDAVKELSPYSHMSSQGFEDYYALVSLGVRSFAYPEQNAVTLKIKRTTGEVVSLRFPWFYTKALRKDLEYFLQFNGFKQADDLGLAYDEKTHTWSDKALEVSRYLPATSLKGLVDEKMYLDDTKAPLLRTGYWISGGKVYAVMQLFSFHSEKAHLGEQEFKFIEPIEKFVGDAKAKGLDLIFDLRRNGGGYGSYPAQVLRVFTESDKSYSNTIWAFRTTRFARELYEQLLYSKVNAELVFGLNRDEMGKVLDDAISNRRVHSKATAGEDIIADTVVGGYKGRIVTLISPSCISACDIMSMLLKSSKRATLIGSETNGTGAGFYSTDTLDAGWKDSYQVFTAKIPNHLFGMPGGTLGQFVYDNTLDLNSENRPTVPDVSYDPSISKDVLGGDQGWMAKAVETLDKLPPR